VGTTVIPNESGDLGAYMASLERLLAEAPSCIYPAHGPKIEDGVGKLREYIAHRHDRERQILAELESGARTIEEIVTVVYAAYPKHLHPAAGQSVCQHLRKLEGDGRTVRQDGAPPLSAVWART
jgi:glyoxylase-like metal-dependent hydrolase (beta-lactamase superfamily II)